MDVLNRLFNEPFESFFKDTILRAGTLLRAAAQNENERGYTRDRHDVDLMIHRFLIEAVRQAYPSHRHLSEEDTDPAEIDPRAITWIIDPVDGSDNFYRGILAYTIAVSVVRGNEILLGAVYEPYVDRLFYARRGGGSAVNGRRLSVSSTSTIECAVVATSKRASFARAGDGGAAAFHRLSEVADLRISSSTALDMCYVASGAIDARVLAGTRVWDHSAATLIVREAGGVVTDWSGAPARLQSRQLVASNGHCHDEILSLLSEMSVPGAKGTVA